METALQNPTSTKLPFAECPDYPCPASMCGKVGEGVIPKVSINMTLRMLLLSIDCNAAERMRQASAGIVGALVHEMHAWQLVGSGAMGAQLQLPGLEGEGEKGRRGLQA